MAHDPELGPVTGYFANPPMKTAGATLGGQGISIVAYSKKRQMAEAFITWFARVDVQKRWWELGGFSCHNEVLNASNFDDSAPYARVSAVDVDGSRFLAIAADEGGLQASQ